MLSRDDYAEIRRMLRPLETRAKLAVSRAVVSLVKDSLGLQSVQATAMVDEVDDYEHMQPGGLTHVPLAGAEGVFVAVGGNRGDGVVICVSDRRHRPKNLGAGETAIYNDSATTQTVVKIAATGKVEVTLATGAALEVNGGTQPVLRGAVFVPALTTFVTAASTLAAAVSTFAGAVGTALPAAATPAATLATACTAFSTACTTFTNALSTVQSTVIKGA
jgi:phage baseplate assembly protein V